MDSDEDRRTITGEYPEKEYRCDFCFQMFPESKIFMIQKDSAVLACEFCKQMWDLI